MYFRCRGNICSITSSINCHNETKILNEVFRDTKNLTPVTITSEKSWWSHVEEDPLAALKINGLFIDEYIVSRITWNLRYTLLPELLETDKSEHEITELVSKFISNLATSLSSMIFPVADILLQRLYKDADTLEERIIQGLKYYY